MSKILPAVAIPGLQPDSLGNYLASLGLLHILPLRWPQTRIAWPEGVLQIVGGPGDLAELLDVLMEVAAQNRWTPYVRTWERAQREAASQKSGRPLALWQSQAEESNLELFAAHAVVSHRRDFNPLLGSGGITGNRSFSDGWKKAVNALKADPRSRPELEAWLTGRPVTWLLPQLNAASWFSEANKLYNSGQHAYREGLLSPWAMALACEGLGLLAGSPSRRLGARSESCGAFPFVTQSAAPLSAGETGRDQAEFWAPLWERPMTLPEVRALFLRGRAEVRGRAAVTPGAFAAAIVSRGIDAGVSEFRRFVLGATTSRQTFEPRFEGAFPLRPPRAVPSTTRPTAVSTLPVTLERVLALLRRLPAERKVGNDRWHYFGLRGPIEAALVRLAAEPESVEAACSLADALVLTLDRVDRNQTLREGRIGWEPLPIGWLPALYIDEPESRLALAMVSAFPPSGSFTLYRFGVEQDGGRFEHPQRPPPSWVWGPGPLPRVLGAVLLRKLLHWEATDDREPRKERERRVALPAGVADVRRWLDGDLEEGKLILWLSRLALFDWRRVPRSVRAMAHAPAALDSANGALLLFGLFQPLFHEEPLRPLSFASSSDGPPSDLLDPSRSEARSPGAARTIAHLLRTGRVDAAVRYAASRYAMANAPLVRTASPWRMGQPERLLASLLFSISPEERAALADRWLRPKRNKEGTHA